MIDHFLRRLTVNRRITGTFMILVLLLALSIPAVVLNQESLLGRLQQVTDVETRADRLLLLASTRVASSRVNLLRYIQDFTPSTYEALDDVDQAEELLTEAQTLIASPDQKTVKRLLEALTDYKTLISAIEAARQTGESQSVNRLQFQAFRLGNDIGQRIELIVKDSETRVAAANKDIYAGARRRMLFLVAGYMGVLALAYILTRMVARSITRPIAGLRNGAEALRSGHLDTVIPVAGRDELGLLAQTFNQLAAQLQELIGSLEQRVADRTRRLEIAATLSEHLTAILNFDQLLDTLVNEVKESFNYYHAHVYVIDGSRQNLVMAAGAGETGAKMKAIRHSIPLDALTSLVARAARRGEIVRVDDVQTAADWLPNPLLPDTCSEMAVPIMLEGQVVGVLDVQEDRVAGLDEGDVSLLRSLANQVAVAIRNARLFAEVETALTETYTAQERYLEQAWQKTKVIPRGGHYLYTQPNAAPLDETKQQALVNIQQQALAQNRPAIIDVGGNDSDPESKIQNQPSNEMKGPKSIVAPINLRDKTIGALQLHTTGNGQTWNEDDLAVIEAVVDQLAQTADNLRLFDETRSRASREQIIREITGKMRSAVSVEELVKTTAEELGKKLLAGHAVVELGIDEDQG